MKSLVNPISILLLIFISVASGGVTFYKAPKVFQYTRPEYSQNSVDIQNSEWREGSNEVVVKITKFDFSRIIAQHRFDRETLSFLEGETFTKREIEEMRVIDAYDTFLWNMFANTPDVKKFDNITGENWNEKWALYKNNLINKAELINLDSQSLKACLQKIKKEEDSYLALLPIGAYRASRGHEKVWIITYKWAYADTYRTIDGNEDYLPLGHIRIVVFTEKTYEKIAFVTCG